MQNKWVMELVNLCFASGQRLDPETKAWSSKIIGWGHAEEYRRIYLPRTQDKGDCHS